MIELYNTTGNELKLGGCTIQEFGTSGSHATIVADITIPANEYLVILNVSTDGVWADHTSSTAVWYSDDDFCDKSMSIKNGGDQLTLICDSTEIDKTPADTTSIEDYNYSMERISTSDGSNIANWQKCTAAGTYATGGLVASPGEVSSPVADTTAPTVTTLAPTDNATGVDPTSAIVITFDEEMNTGVGSVTFNPSVTGVSGAWTVPDTVYTVSHDAFSDATPYEIILTGFEDASGNALDTGSAWTPSTGETTYNIVTSGTDTVDPQVNATLAYVSDDTFELTYNEAMDPTTTETPGNYAVSGSCTSGETVTNASLAGNTVTLTLSAAVTCADTEQVIITVSNAEDLAGNTVDPAANEATYTYSTPPTTIWQESFETDGQSTRYTASTPFNDGGNDHWNRTDGSDITNTSSAYSSFDGTYFWAAEDVDDDGGNGNPEQTISITGITITGYTNLTFKGLFGTGNNNGPGASQYDQADYIKITYSIDSGAETDLLWFSFVDAGDDYNEPLAYDANMDGDGEGTVLTASLAEFTASILTNGDSLDLTIKVSMNSGDEEIAFDNLQVTGVN